MLNTMNYAVFNYKGYVVSAKRLVDVMTDKDFGWTGCVAKCNVLADDNENRIVAKSIMQFEKKFIEFVDNQIAKAALTKSSPVEEW